MEREATANLDESPRLRSLNRGARYILHVAPRRLLARAEILERALRNFKPNRRREFDESLDRVHNLEGMAVFASVPVESRAELIEELDLDPGQRERLRELVDLIGDSADPNSPASALVAMFPGIDRPDPPAKSPSVSVEQPPPAPDSNEGVPELVATIAVWTSDAAARRAMKILVPVFLQHGASDLLLPREFWVAAARRLRALDDPDDLYLLGLLADLLVRRGETEFARELLESLLDRASDDRGRAEILVGLADLHRMRGEFDDARRLLETSVTLLNGHEREVAVVRGRIADILQTRGDFDEALRIRREEELPVFERLGDVRERAVTMAKIADVLQARGDLDESLRIRREEQLPVFERLGDVRSRAVTMGKIADILQARGELDESLRIRREEQLPVYERLGDVRGRAVTMWKIAIDAWRRGRAAEAKRIIREDVLPVFERLGLKPDYTKAEELLRDIEKESPEEGEGGNMPSRNESERSGGTRAREVEAG